MITNLYQIDNYTLLEEIYKYTETWTFNHRKT
jgi:hypothetical protein